MTYLIHILAALGLFLAGDRHRNAMWLRKLRGPNELDIARARARWSKERGKANPAMRALDGGRR